MTARRHTSHTSLATDKNSRVIACARRWTAVLVTLIIAACGQDGGDTTADPSFIPGVSYFTPDSFIEYVPGDIPLLLTVPHGGTIRPAEIADRVGADTIGDKLTAEVAAVIDSVFHQTTGGHPYRVICHLHRVKLDCNRSLAEAAMGDTVAGRAWKAFHDLVDTAKAQILADHGRGLVIDLHGHGHPIARLELGYELTSAQLDLSDSVLNQALWLDSVSVRDLALRSNTLLATLLRGANSLGSLLATRGYDAVPSSGTPSPGGAAYYTGGYNTRRNGSRHGGTLSALQMETPLPGVRATAATRHAFAEAFVPSAMEFLALYLGLTW